MENGQMLPLQIKICIIITLVKPLIFLSTAAVAAHSTAKLKVQLHKDIIKDIKLQYSGREEWLDSFDTRGYLL